MKFMTSLTPLQLKECFNETSIIELAESLLQVEPPHITQHVAQYSEGGKHDFYSNGDFWWPNPSTPDGLPFVQRDGQTNPGNFTAHRTSLRTMRTSTAHLAAAYHITKDEKYAQKAVEFLKVFFLDADTKMNPHLLYAQAIPGVCPGRGIGIIDTLHLVDVPVAIELLKNSQAMGGHVYEGLQGWFASYLHWITTHPQGIEEMDHPNNHGVCWNVQAAMFAKFTNNTEIMELCRKRYKEVYLPQQMRPDGTFPEELRRTKPYNYSCFVVDNMVNICQILSTKEDNLWEFTLENGTSIKTAIDYIVPFIEDITTWPHHKDVQYFDEFPAAMPFLLFAGAAYGRENYLGLWTKLAQKTQGEEMRRNIAVRQAYIWLCS